MIKQSGKTLNGIKETSLYVADLSITEKFYHERLNFPVISRVEGRHIFFRAGNSLLLCFLPEATRNDEEMPPHYANGQIHLAFEVPKNMYYPFKEWIQNQGIPIEFEKHWHDDFLSFYFRDPDNHSLEILTEGMWGF